MKKIYFTLKPSVFIGQCTKGIVILDVIKNKYFSITQEAGSFLETILKHEFYPEGDSYKLDIQDVDSELINSWISFFLQQGLIEVSHDHNKRFIAKAKLEGGLRDYKWDRKDLPITFGVPKLLMLESYWMLIKVNRALKKKGILGVLELIEAYAKKNKNYSLPDKEKVDTFAATLDSACALYWKKNYCLTWAASFVLMLLKKGYQASLVIGVQSPPFYAHAWAEVNGQVINDAAMIQDYFAILLKEPFQ